MLATGFSTPDQPTEDPRSAIQGSADLYKEERVKEIVDEIINDADALDEAILEYVGAAPKDKQKQREATYKHAQHQVIALSNNSPIQTLGTHAAYEAAEKRFAQELRDADEI